MALQFNGVPHGICDIFIGMAILCFIIFETIAGNQHWNYQSEKWKRIRQKENLEGDYKKGFLDNGQWAYSRHPNYLAEQAVWLLFYLFSIVTSGQWLNWFIAGCLLLILLFQGSSGFSEEISAQIYHLYIDYKKRVPRFFGRFKRSK